MLERLLKLACATAMVLALCAVSSGGDVPFDARSAEASYAVPNDFVYQLQNIDLSAIGKTKFDLVVMDYSRDGSDERKFSAQQIDALKSSPGGRKRVLAYMSIGEAEDYRFYWQRSWDADRDGQPDADAPTWLGPSNPDWPGNYKARYWDPAWQQIVHQYLDKVLAAGYDGVYLDIVDAYEYWGPGGESGLDRPMAEDEMVTFVKSIANYARVAKGRSGFQVFVQNAEGLSRHPDYVQTVSGIGKEDLFYDGNRRQPAEEIRYSVRRLDRFKQAGKPVLVIDYVTRQATIDDFYRKAHNRSYVPYATRRDLDILTINPGHAPD